MRAVILVGGFGTRLRPLTWHTPKQMLPVVGQTMLERVVTELASGGVTDVVLSLGFKPDAFLEAYPDGIVDGVTLHYAVEPEPLDTAGAVRFAARSAGIDSRFIVVNGDVLTDLDIKAVWRLHEERGAEGTIALTRVDDPSRYGVVPIDDDNRVVEFVEKPPRDQAPSHWINAGTYVLEPSVLDRIPADRKVSIEREVFPTMVADRTLFALHSDAYWVDAGTPETYLQAQLDLIDGLRGRTEPAIADDVVIERGARVDRSVLMSGVHIGRDAKVKDSVVLPGAVIEAEAEVMGSVVGPLARVGRASSLGGLTVLGEGVVVEAGAQLTGARLPDQPQPDPHLA